MSERSALRGELAWNLLGTGLLAVSGYAVLASVAKLVSTDALGRYGLGVAVAAPAFVLSNMSLRSLYVTDPPAERRFDEYLAFRLLATLAMATVLTIGWLLAEPDASRRTVGVLVVVSTGIDAVRDLLAGAFQRHGRAVLMGQSLALRGLSRAILVPGAVALTHSLEIGLALDVASALAVMLLFDWRIIAGLRLEPMLRRAALSWPVARRLVRRALPLSVALVLAMLQGHVPRFVIEHELGTTALGFWVALDGTSRLASPLYSAASSVMLPRLSRGERDFLRVLRTYLLGCVVLGAMTVAAFAVVGGEVLGRLFAPAHRANAHVLVIVAAGAATQQVANVFGVALTARRRFFAPLAPQVVTTLLAAAALLHFLPAGGLEGAAMVVLVQNLALAILFGGLVWTHSRSTPEGAS